MIANIFRIASTLAVIAATLAPSLAKDSIMAPVPGEKFYFGRKLIDVKAVNSEVPQVDPATIVPYDQLGLADEFYLGQSDVNGRLIHLETWQREHEDEISLETLIDGKPLSEYDVPITESDTSRQMPQFFVSRDDEWHWVPAEQTEGVSRFIRLRWLKSLDGHSIRKDAEVLQQNLAFTTVYVYDLNGDISEIRRDFGSGVAPEVIYPHPQR